MIDSIRGPAGDPREECDFSDWDRLANERGNMDPEKCLEKLLEAFVDGDRDAAVEHLEDLRGWLKVGGYMPRVASRPFEVGPQGLSKGKEVSGHGPEPMEHQSHPGPSFPAWWPEKKHE